MAVVPGAGGGMMPVAGLNGGAPRGDAPISCRSVLDDAYHLISSGQIEQGMELLMGGLSELRRGCGPDEWDTIFQAEAADHPVARLVWQDPFTAHSFRKPRGYPGDAALLDYIYGCTPIPAETSEIGQAIFQFNRERQAPRSVRARAQVLAGMIDETAALFPSPRILSVASGHLREAALSTAVAEGRIGELVALDQDAESLTAGAPRFRRQTGHGGERLGPFDPRRKSAFREHASGVRRGVVRLPLGPRRVPVDPPHVRHARPRRTTADRQFHARSGRHRLHRKLHGVEAHLPRPRSIDRRWARDIASSEWHSHRLFWDEHESIIFLEIVKRRARQKDHVIWAGDLVGRRPGAEARERFFGSDCASRHGHDGANGNGKTSGNGNRNGNGRHVEHGPEAESGA